MKLHTQVALSFACLLPSLLQGCVPKTLPTSNAPTSTAPAQSSARVGRQTVYTVSDAPLVSPLRIVSAEYFADGGSIEIVVRDSTGRELRLISHTPIIAGSNQAEGDRKVKEVWRIYLGGFPGMPGAVAMERGGADQLEVQRFLTDCIADAEAGSYPLVDPGPDAPAYIGRSPQADRYVSGFMKRLEREIQTYGPSNAPS